MTTPTERPDDAPTTATPTVIRDLHTKPRGVLPRHVQMWLMIGIAIIILAIILLAGHPQPVPRAQVGSQPAAPTLVPPERIRSYQQQLAADLAREQQALDQAASGARATQPPSTPSAAATDPTADDQRRREYQSLFADNVALSRRSPDRQPFGEPRQTDTTAPPTPSQTVPDLRLLEQLLARNASAPAPTRNAPQVPLPPAAVAASALPGAEAPPHAGAIEETAPPKETGPIRSSDPLQRLVEGTVMETVLINRLDGTFAGPVECLVTTPVYSHDRQAVVIPAGARVLGSASPVQTWGDSRLAVSFHRIVMPDGRTYSLDRFKGLGQSGDTGLKHSVDRHYLQVFGASLAIGALSGLAQLGTRGSIDAYSFGDSFRQGAGSSLAASAGRVLDRYLNVLPTITIREGYRIKVYLTSDLQLPPYAAVTVGGSR